VNISNNFCVTLFFSIFLIFIWIGAQFPQEKFLSYARILTFDYFFLILIITLSKRKLDDFIRVSSHLC
jgi:hypothetical protein